MKASYLCPHCRGAINAENNIILSAKTKNNRVGLALLHEDLGNYSVSLSSSLQVETGEVVDFFCPICHACLNVLKGDDLARYIRIEDGLKESFIIISRKYGERITFKVGEDKKVESYGEKISRFLDPEWFL